MIFGCCNSRKYGKGCTPETCMALPDGLTCGDCVNRKRCMALGYTNDLNRNNCDFFPRRFRPIPAATDDGGTP